jgi:hypothetical protein
VRRPVLADANIEETFMKTLVITLVALGALAFATTASAHHHHHMMWHHHHHHHHHL